MKYLKCIFIFVVFILIISIIIILFQKGCGYKKGCTHNTDCNPSYICVDGTCVKSGCTPPCTGGSVCVDGTCIPDSSPSIQSQPNSSIQLVNYTSENYLHVFVQCHRTTQKWKQISGNGVIYDAVNWTVPGKGGKGNISWDPVGAEILSEFIIPKNGFIIFDIGNDAGTFIMQPIKMKNPNDNTPLKSTDEHCANTLCRVAQQSSLLFEGGKDVVADISGVNGINFKVKYSLTTENGIIKTMEIKRNPCASLSDEFKNKYKVDIGCWSPAKKICTGATCDCCCCYDPITKTKSGDYAKGLCKIANQDCKFNDCSQKLFNIDPDLKQFIGHYDGGKPNERVKPFINLTSNLIVGTDQQKYCSDMQYDTGDFTSYCYDYNDLSSSQNLRFPYKAKIVYMDL